MPYPIQLRLSLSYLFVLLLGIGLAIGLTWTAVEQIYLKTQKENLIAQATLTATALGETSLPVESGQPYMQTSNVVPGVHTRLLSESGGVVVGLPEFHGNQLQEVPPAENVGFVSSEAILQRPEIQQALQGIAMTTVRRVDSANRARVLYATAPIWDERDQVVGIVYLATPLPRTGLPLDLLLKMAGTVLLATSLAGFTGTRLARNIARPIEALDNAAAAVAKGDLNQVVVIKPNISELERLNESFNTMVSSLQQSNQAKNAFIADVTHELRTPLTVIKGTIETMEDGALDDLEGRTTLLAAMGRETDRLIRLVNDLLVLTRADASALQLKIQPLDLSVLARSRCEQLALLADGRRVNLQVFTIDPEKGFWVNGDTDRLAQVLDNLLVNAVRHSPIGSMVGITIQRQSQEILCEVVDQGPGIPAQHLPHIFDRFYRVDSSRDRKTGGTGLGLAIVQALVKAHKGRINVESKEGEGSNFRIWLPAIELP